MDKSGLIMGINKKFTNILYYSMQAYQLDCYFRQSWVDERLSFTSSMDKLAVSVHVLDRLWKPDTHFFNGRKSYLHTITTPNKLLRISKDGRILYSMRQVYGSQCSFSAQISTNYTYIYIY